MTSIITGDIINSAKVSPQIWVDALKSLLSDYGTNISDWEIYRGDEFQIMVSPAEALIVSIAIKATLRTLKMDARISIGIGDISYKGTRLTESNGSAFIRSGQMFESLRQRKISLAINSGNTVFDDQFNLLFRFMVAVTDGWLPQSAEFVITAIQNPILQQDEIGKKLGINQAAVSRRQKRAQYELISDLEQYYREQIKHISV